MSNQGYKLGKLAGQHAVKLGIALAVAAVAVWFFTNDPNQKTTGGAPEKTNQAAAAATVATLDPCLVDRPSRLQTAIKLLKQNKFDEASDMLYVCTGKMSADEKAVYTKALTAGNAARANIADAEARAIKAEKKRQGVRIGMTQQDVLDSSWGKPRNINRTTNRYGVREQWVYGGSYLYFEDGVLTSIQN